MVRLNACLLKAVWTTPMKQQLAFIYNHLPSKTVIISHLSSSLSFPHIHFSHSWGQTRNTILWSCFLHIMFSHKWLPHVNPTQGLMTAPESTVHQFCISPNQTPTTDRRVQQGHGCSVNATRWPKGTKSVLYPGLSGFKVLLTGKLGRGGCSRTFGSILVCGQLIMFRIKCQSPPKETLDHKRRECKLSALGNMGIKS